MKRAGRCGSASELRLPYAQHVVTVRLQHNQGSFCCYLSERGYFLAGRVVGGVRPSFQTAG